MEALSHTELKSLLVDLVKSDEVSPLVKEALSSRRLDAWEGLGGSLDVFYLMYAATIVFLMQAGFAMVEAGTVREKNVKNVLMKNIMDPCIGVLAFWGAGYGICYGHSSNVDDETTWFGDEWWILGGEFESEDSYHGFFFQFAFAATAATIVSGAVAERCTVTAYVLYSGFLTAWVYPVVVHAIWSTYGKLSAFSADPLRGIGVIDFAGCGVVHMVGGIAAFIGAAVLGPRAGRFDPMTGKIDDPMPGHNMALVVLGTFILWFGWYGFNPGSTLGISPAGYDYIAAKTAVTTTIAAGMGCVSNVCIHKMLKGVLSLEEACNGVLAGLVGITSACSVVEPWAAAAIGIGGAVFYTIGELTCVSFQIDDPCNASGVHFFAGVWGLLAPGLFASQKMVETTYGPSMAGIWDGGTWTIFINQAIATGAVIAWVAANMIPFFVILKCVGLFRVSKNMEEAGMDASEHGGAGYNH